MFKEVNSESFDNEVVKSDLPVLVDFWGPRCVPCLALKPEVEKLAEKYKDQIKVVGIDASQNKRLCLNLRVIGLPTFLVYKKGEEVKRLKGNDLKISEIESAIQENIE